MQAIPKTKDVTNLPDKPFRDSEFFKDIGEIA
jgi:hypothetical protein